MTTGDLTAKGAWNAKGYGQCGRGTGDRRCGRLLFHLVLMWDRSPLGQRKIPLFLGGFLTEARTGIWTLTPDALERVRAGEPPRFNRSLADTARDGKRPTYTGHSVVQKPEDRWPGMTPRATVLTHRAYADGFPVTVRCYECGGLSVFGEPPPEVRALQWENFTGPRT